MDPNVEICNSCSQFIIKQYGKWPLNDDWDNLYTLFFTYKNNWILRQIGKKMRNIKYFYSISISAIGLETRKIAELVTMYYTVNIIRKSTVKQELAKKLNFKNRINVLEGFIEKDILNRLHSLREKGNNIAHAFDLTKDIGEDKKRELLDEITSFLLPFHQSIKKDKRCAYYVYNNIGCNGINCQFKHTLNK